MNQKRIQIDIEGDIVFDGNKVTDAEFGRKVLASLTTRDGITYANMDNEEFVVEAFDAPLMIRGIDKGSANDSETLWQLQGSYDFKMPFDLKNLHLDDWDRFCGHFDTGVPFVFSRAAQGQFFNMLDDYTDNSILVGNTNITIENKFKNASSISTQDFWSDFYKTKETPWDLDGPSPVLKHALLQLKLPRQRILVLGAGKGHDAVELARAGHVVTAVDFSPDAFEAYKSKYGNKVSDLKYLIADAFQPPTEFTQSFDVVFDHTFFCAVEPKRRKEVVNLWKRALQPRGHLLAVFFLMDKDEGPPFGATEWELHQLIKKDFEPLYWTRSNVSIPTRANRELLVYASKKD